MQLSIDMINNNVTARCTPSISNSCINGSVYDDL